MNFGLAGDQPSHRTRVARVARHAVPPRAGHCDRAAVNLNTPAVSALAAGRPRWREDRSARILDGRLRCFALTEPETGSDITALRTTTVCAALTEFVLASGDQIIAGPTGKVHMFLMRKRHVAEMAAR